jgi:ABC-2 type transport system ATP-binding protein
MTAAIEINNLVKTYKNGVTAVKDISLRVEQGDFFALLGPNGAGKSTTIGIVSSLITKTSGQIKIFGTDLDENPALAKHYIGLVPQEFNFNVFEPVVEIVVNQAGYYGIPRKQAFERAEGLLKQLQLWDKRREMARNLSGGMKRRLMIARALVHEPKLLILDEPTAGVDVEIRYSMWEFLRKKNAEGTTIVLTTHYLEEAESLCRNIAIIDNGVICHNSSMKHLISQLNKETFILDLANQISTAPVIEDFVVRLIDDTTLEVEIEREKNLNDVFAVLNREAIHVSSMRNKVNRLEELFMSLVNENTRGS